MNRKDKPRKGLFRTQIIAGIGAGIIPISLLAATLLVLLLAAAHLQAVLSFGLDGIAGTITGWTPAPPQDLPGE